MEELGARLARVEVVVHRLAELVPTGSEYLGQVAREDRCEGDRALVLGQLAELPEHTLQTLARVLQVLRLEVDRTTVGPADQEEAQGRRAVGVEQLARLELARELRVGHARVALGDLAAAVLHQAVVQPQVRERVAVGLALGDLVLVVRELEVVPATVQVEVPAEELARHHRALDVPPRPACAPRAVPGGLAGLGQLPQCEVRGVAQSALGLDPRTGLHVIDVAPGELAVALMFLDVEVDSVVRGVGTVLVDQLLDEADHPVHVFGATRVVGDRADAQLAQELEVLFRVALGDRLPVLALGDRTVDDLVVDVRDVVHELDPVAPGDQPARDRVEDHRAHQVADVAVVVDGRAAGVELDLLRIEGLEGLLLPFETVVDADHHGGGRIATARRAALGPARLLQRCRRSQRGRLDCRARPPRVSCPVTPCCTRTRSAP